MLNAVRSLPYAVQIVAQDPNTGADALQVGDSVSNAVRVNVVASEDSDAQGLTLAALAARSATFASAALSNSGNRGVQIFVNIPSGDYPVGGAGLKPEVEGFDPASGAWFSLLTATTAITAAGFFWYVAYPGYNSGTGANQQSNVSLPAQWRVVINHLDGDTYTYSVGACLLP